jgi:hypothetical protein
MSIGFEKYADLVRRGRLPDDFTQWALARSDGRTVAHIAAIYDQLPSTFNQWSLADSNGWTVAHEVAKSRYLPADFDQWELVSETGWTVGHEAARHEHLPEDFNQWGLPNKKNESILKCTLLRASCIKFTEKWETEKPLCKTSADWEVFKKELPEIYQKYTVVELLDDVDATSEMPLL